MNTQHSAVVFAVKNLANAKDHYINTLGFELDFEYDNYLGVRHGEVAIHLSAGEPVADRIGKGSIYIFCNEVDQYYQEITEKGAASTGEPKDYFYGMRDFITTDPDGNRLSFGCGI